MASEEDPEARIRELERSLSDQAQRSELGTGAFESGNPLSYLPPPLPPPAYGTPPPLPPEYGAPPPSYPPPSYDASPYPAQFGAPAPKLGGVAARGVFFALAGVIVVVAAGIAAFVVGNTEKTISTNPFGNQPSVHHSNNTPIISIGPAEPPVEVPTAPDTSSPTTVAAGESVGVSGISENRTIACEAGEVRISGVTNTVTITGHCARVEVSGMNNVITVDESDAINASGLGNKVTYHAGTPEVSNSGSDNTVEQG